MLARLTIGAPPHVQFVKFDKPHCQIEHESYLDSVNLQIYFQLYLTVILEIKPDKGFSLGMKDRSGQPRLGFNYKQKLAT